MAWGVNDGVMPPIREKLFGGTGDGDTTFTFILLPVHVKGKGKGGLAQTLGLLLQLFHFTLRNTTELKQQATRRGGFTRIDVTANDDRQMFLSVSHCFVSKVFNVRVCASV